MPLYRHKLPQLSDQLFLTDGGLETTLIFDHGIELPEFAAFVLLETEEGCETLSEYYRLYSDIARKRKIGFILETPTWRANRDWGRKIGYTEKELDAINHKSVLLLESIRAEYRDVLPHMVISGCLGPRGDGYDGSIAMTVNEAANYHRQQIASFRETEADMVTAMTITYIAEAIGITLAAKSENMPVAISFTVETDGRLPSGESLQLAIEQVDAATDSVAVYYMINCAHPTHFADSLGDSAWTKRIRAIRANASMKSHAELDESTELDAGNPKELGQQYLELDKMLANLNVLGGCCGTDHRHVDTICKAFAG